MTIDTILLRRLRAEKHWSQEQLAAACGLNLRTIQRLEKTGRASTESVRALAAVFGITPNELLQTEDSAAATPYRSVSDAISRYVDFHGSVGRAGYWWFVLFVLLSTGVAMLLHERLAQMVGLLLLLPLLAVGARRLHDIGHSGWWQLLFLVPFGQVVVFYMLALAGRPEVAADPNRLDTG